MTSAPRPDPIRGFHGPGSVMWKVNREAVLLVDGPWPRAEAQLAVSRLSWSGVGAGFGYLTSREVTVTVSSRRSALRRSVRLVLPTPEGRLTAVAAVAQTPTILRAVG